MSEAAAEEMVAEEVESSVEDVAEEFSLFTEVSDEEPVKEPEPVEEVVAKEEPKEDSAWSAKIRKDKQLHQREIDLKKREEDLKIGEGRVTAVNGLRDKLINDPEQVLKDLGIDPVDLYTDWTRRMVNDSKDVSPELRMSSQEKRLQELEGELRKRDEMDAKRAHERERDAAIGTYHAQIRDFLKETSDFPLTKEQLSPEDIAQGIASYYRETGKELEFHEACQKIEDGLTMEENKLLENPRLIERFKSRSGLGANEKQDRVAPKTLSSSMTTHPSRTSTGEYPTLEEVIEEFEGRLLVSN